MVLYINSKTEERFKSYVFSKSYTHGDLSRIATEAIEFFLDAHEVKDE